MMMIVLCDELMEVVVNFGIVVWVCMLGGVCVFGVYFEGLYINFGKFGVQFDVVVLVVFDEVFKYLLIVLICVVMFVLEIVGYIEIIGEMVVCGVCVQFGYLFVIYDDVVVVFKYGVCGFMYLFNVMLLLYYCNLGFVGVVFVYVEYVEIIFDLLYVYLGVICVVLCVILCLYVVIDSMFVIGMFDGEYWFGSQYVMKCFGGVWFVDGMFVGSMLMMDQVLCNFVLFGLLIVDVLNWMLCYVVDYFGVIDCGCFECGVWVDFVVFDCDLNFIVIYVEGELIVEYV